MPNRPRSKLFTAVTLLTGLIVFSLLLILVWETSASHTERHVKAQSNTTEYSYQSQQRIADDCIVLEPIAMAECIKSVIESTYEHQRDQDGLTAQRDMAQWAALMNIIAAASVVVTTVGVVYVAFTLGEARRTTLAAIRAAKAARSANDLLESFSKRELRAYITVDIRGGMLVGEERQSLRIYIGLTNTGQTPAKTSEA